LEYLQPENRMLRTLLSASLALSAVSLASQAAESKPCDGLTAAPALEQMLPLARTALDLPGTAQVALDPARRCIGIEVRSPGTARLVKLILRGVAVPRSAVELRVVQPPTPTGA
jgi:hypothetical protein